MSFELTLSALQQRVLALALAFVPLFLVLIGSASFVSTQITHHRHVSLLVRELNHYEALQREAPKWQTQLTALKLSPWWQNLFLAEAGTQSANVSSQISWRKSLQRPAARCCKVLQR